MSQTPGAFGKRKVFEPRCNQHVKAPRAIVGKDDRIPEVVRIAPLRRRGKRLGAGLSEVDPIGACGQSKVLRPVLHADRIIGIVCTIVEEHGARADGGLPVFRDG